MVTFIKIFVVVVLALALIGWLADRRAAANRPDVTPGLSFLPGDIKYESPSGNVRVYFPIVTSIVLSVVLTLILRSSAECGTCFWRLPSNQVTSGHKSAIAV